MRPLLRPTSVRHAWCSLAVHRPPGPPHSSPPSRLPPLPRHLLHIPTTPSPPPSPSSSPSPSPPSYPEQYFSGIQPTGILHLGNYLGAIQPWLRLQRQVQAAQASSTTSPPPNKLLISVVDLHAITLPQPPSTLHSTSLSLATFLLACGLHPSSTSLFLQSHVRQHAELTWLLSCITPHAWLNHMTQFKEKSRATPLPSPPYPSPSFPSPHTPSPTPTSVSLGLYSYPLLMAADILLYQTTVVPVGHDQAQHLELTRSIAHRFNTLYPPPRSPTSPPTSPPTPPLFPLFPLPSTFTSPTPRVMSLRDPTKKMSKSDPLDASRINFTDSPDVIAGKVRKAVTDSMEGVPREGVGGAEGGAVEEGREGMVNLMGMLVGCGGRGWEEVRRDVRYAKGGKAALKEEVVEAVVSVVEPVRKEWERLSREQGAVEQVLKQGAAEAREKAERTIDQVKELIGFVRPF